VGLARDAADRPTGLRWLVRDITERKGVEEALRQSEERYRTLFDLESDAVFMVDNESGRLLEANAGAASLYGYSREEFLAMKNTDLSAEPEDTRRVTAETPVAADRIVRIPLRYHRRKDGTVFPVEITGRFFEWGGRKVHIAAIRDITERKRAEAALAESEQRFRTLAEAPFEGIALIEQGVFTDVSDQLASMLGYTREELLGKPVMRVIAPESRDRVAEAIRTGRLESYEHLTLRKDGTVFPVEVRARIAEIGGRQVRISAVRDIGERKRTEQALRESRELYRALFEGVTDAVYVCHITEDGLPGKFIEVNEVACRRLGYTREELLRLGIADIDAPDSTVDARSLVAALPTRGAVLFEQLHVAKNGRRIPVEIHARQIMVQDRPAILSVVRDITERKRDEEERRRLEEKMRHVQKLQSLGVLAGGIAHDFNNLLTAIQGNADLALLSLPPTAPARRHVKEIEGVVRRAAELCRQMLAYAGKGRFVVQRHDLSIVVREMTSILDASISKKAVLRYRLAPVLPAIEADATQLRQVIMNLITNASEALGEGSGIVSVFTGVMQCDRAYLEESALGQELPEGLYVYLEVADTGCGMDAETQQRIFDPFFTTKFTGRGLGLAAVLGIVRGHRGAIKVYSKPGQGSTFTILFPMAQGEPAPADVTPEVPTTWRGSGTVLLVDDEEPVRNVAKEMLERLGFRVVTAADGREALATFRVHADRVVCVLLDLTMPRMNGVETFRELRGLRADLRIILSSGYDEQDAIQRFAGRGLAGFIQKPYTLGALQEALRRVLG
jgi:PAS domain S-box-containing protein